MAASRSTQQLAEIGAFVQQLFERGGYATWKEFADDAKISAPQVSDFQRGESEPSGYNLLRLIQVAAERAQQESAEFAALLAREAASDQAARLEGRLGGVEAGVAQLLAGQAQLIDQVSEALTREQPAPPKAARKPQEKR